MESNALPADGLDLTVKAEGTRVSFKKRILTLLIIGFSMALTVEAGARLILRHQEPEEVVPASIGRFDEKLGWALRPLAHATSKRTGSEIDYRINSLGLRNRETPYKKPEGVFRIVLVGDSRTFGWGVPLEKHFSTLLEGYFKDVEVINMGVSGFGVDQELLFLDSEGFRYEPDLVIAYVSHYGDNRHMHSERWGNGKPQFKLIDGKLTLTNSPVVQRNIEPTRFGRLNAWLSEHSATYRILRAGLTSSQNQEDGATLQASEDEKDLQNPAFRAELNDVGEAIVYQMNEDAGKHGAEFVLVTQIEELNQAALKKRIFSLDVLEALSNDRFVLSAPLGHINESGNGVLAWEIANFLKANKLIPTSHLRTPRNSNL